MFETKGPDTLSSASANFAKSDNVWCQNTKASYSGSNLANNIAHLEFFLPMSSNITVT